MGSGTVRNVDSGTLESVCPVVRSSAPAASVTIPHDAADGTRACPAPPGRPLWPPPSFTRSAGRLAPTGGPPSQPRQARAGQLRFGEDFPGPRSPTEAGITSMTIDPDTTRRPKSAGPGGAGEVCVQWFRAVLLVGGTRTRESLGRPVERFRGLHASGSERANQGRLRYDDGGHSQVLGACSSTASDCGGDGGRSPAGCAGGSGPRTAPAADPGRVSGCAVRDRPGGPPRR